MVNLFLGHVLVKNNRERDELDMKCEVVLRLQNRVLLLLFAAAYCDGCRQFAPTLKDFVTHLTDEFYVDRSVQLVLLYISDLKAMFEVEDLSTVVVLRPDCSVLIPNAVEEIRCLGPDCFRNWQEAAELIDRNFMINEDFDETSMRSFSDPVRQLKYKVEDDGGKRKMKKKKMRSGRGIGNVEEEEVEKTNDEGGGAVVRKTVTQNFFFMRHINAGVNADKISICISWVESDFIRKE